MEKKLKRLLEYQRFEKNEKLEKLIRDTESRYAAELSDDDLSLVNAAGETDGKCGGLIGSPYGVGEKSENERSEDINWEQLIEG